MRNSRSIRRRPGGFTLLELVLAMLVLALLVGMIFGSASANLELSNTVVRKQNEEGERNAFFEQGQFDFVVVIAASESAEFEHGGLQLSR